MSDYTELYQQVILDHNKNPKNFTRIEPHTHHSEGYNPLCGDRIELFLEVEDGIIKNVGFQGSGCAISKASASLMTSLVKGKSVAEAEELFKKFQQLITGKIDVESNLENLGKLSVFEGVRNYPVRIKCAALSWHALIAALKEQEKSISTEDKL